MKGLFINCPKAKDSIFESGLMVFRCLSISTYYKLDYIEISVDNKVIPTGYDFFVFNYHDITMSWLDTACIKDLPGLTITFILETLTNDPFVRCPEGDFDIYCALDPTMKVDKENVYAFPRPLEVPTNTFLEYVENDVPVIGSFGFATKGKGFEHVVDAVNSEFDRAIIKINIPFASYADKTHSYALQLSESCKTRAKEGIEVIVTHDFMDKDELIKWCSRNTLNCFLYDRIMPGLSATTDQAISSGRPLSVSNNETFRHITEFIVPYPFQTLKESIKNNQTIVHQIQKAWSPENFKLKFEEMLRKNNNKLQNSSILNNGGHMELRSFRNTKFNLYFRLIKSKLAYYFNLLVGNDIRGTYSEVKNSFLNSIIPQFKPSYSQFGEDLIIKRIFEDEGINTYSYLDIGANEPVFISNTYLFYRNGKTGVLVEPNPVLYKKNVQKRRKDVSLNIGIGIDDKEEADFHMFPNYANGLNTFSKSEAEFWQNTGNESIGRHKVEKINKVPLKNINVIIREYLKDIPFFISISVKGLDFQILKTFDFEVSKPLVLCVDTLEYFENKSTHRKTEIIDFLDSKGYSAYAYTKVNTIFKLWSDKRN